jgi:hypothetical protein
VRCKEEGQCLILFSVNNAQCFFSLCNNTQPMFVY